MKILRNIVILSCIIAFQACATFKPYYSPSTGTGFPAFEPKRDYLVKTAEGREYVTVGKLIKVESASITFPDIKTDQFYTVPTTQIIEIKEKRFSTGATVAGVVGSVIAAAGFITAIAFLGLAGANK